MNLLKSKTWLRSGWGNASKGDICRNVACGSQLGDDGGLQATQGENEGVDASLLYDGVGNNNNGSCSCARRGSLSVFNNNVPNDKAHCGAH